MADKKVQPKAVKVEKKDASALIDKLDSVVLGKHRLSLDDVVELKSFLESL